MKKSKFTEAFKMIAKIDKSEIINNTLQVSKGDSDRPPIKRSLNKLFFFILREGISKTFKKVSSKFISENKSNKETLKGIICSKAAISYDNGDNWYIHSTGTNLQTFDEWYNPFSSDSELELSEANLIPSNNDAEVFIFGGGDYVRSYILNNFKRDKYFLICDYNDSVLQGFKEFKYRINNWKNALIPWSEMTNPIAVIATYHSNHASQAYQLVKANKSSFIFIEKPPLVDFKSEYSKYEQIYELKSNIEIGFNRRYARMITDAKKHLDNLNGPTILNFSVNEIIINSNHWYHWESEGTRITGNACHWIDLAIYLTNSEPIELTLAKSISSEEELTLIIKFNDGSLSTISISESGSTLRGVHEQLIMKKENTTIHIDDFITFTLDDESGRTKKYSIKRDKGHDSMYKDFSSRVDNHTKGIEVFTTRYPLTDLKKVTYITYHFSQMAKKNITSYKISL